MNEADAAETMKKASNYSAPKVSVANSRTTRNVWFVNPSSLIFQTVLVELLAKCSEGSYEPEDNWCFSSPLLSLVS